MTVTTTSKILDGAYFGGLGTVWMLAHTRWAGDGSDVGDSPVSSNIRRTKRAVPSFKAVPGKVYPGWKVVEGKSFRRFTDDAAVAEMVSAAGKDPWERKLLGISALEKLLGKKRFSELLSDMVIRPEGKPTLVPEEDPRPERGSAEKDFGETV